MLRLIFVAGSVSMLALLGGHAPMIPTVSGPGQAVKLTGSFDSDRYEVGKLQGEELYILGVAHLPGFNQTQWRTSMEVCNFASTQQEYELTFLTRGEDNTGAPGVTLALSPGRCMRYDDVVHSVFELDGAAGAVKVAAGADGLVVQARTANEGGDGTFGSGQSAYPADEALARGLRAVLPHLSQSADPNTGYRTNLELLNTTAQTIIVDVDLHHSSSIQLGSLNVELLPYSSKILTKVFERVTGAGVEDGYAVVSSQTPGSAFLAEASLVDNRTGDGTTIQAIRLPEPGPWQDPNNAGPAVNSASNDWYPTIASDGSFMVFVSERPGGFGSCDLYISRRIDGVWQEAENMGANVNTSGCESAPYIAADDQKLFFASFAGGGHGGMDVWWCPLENGVPGQRVNMEAPINGPWLDCCPVLSKDGNTLFICSDRPGGSGSMDVWVSRRVDGVWQEPENLSLEINSSSTDCPRWLSDDGTTLIISSTRHDGLGNADLWVLYWNGESWSVPTNLGLPVNSSAPEWGPGFLDNGGALGGTIFFGSGRPGGEGGWDIWSSAYRDDPDKRSTSRAVPSRNRDDGDRLKTADASDRGAGARSDEGVRPQPEPSSSSAEGECTCSRLAGQRGGA